MAFPEAIIFDTDGVIVDTVSYHYLAWKSAFKKVGIDLSWEDYRKLVNGIPRINGAKNVLGENLRDRLGSSGREMVEVHYTKEIMGKCVSDVYKKVLR